MTWWRNNRIALLAVVVLLPLTLGIPFANQWLGYFSTWPSVPEEVLGADPVEYGGTTWTVDGARRITAASAEGREYGLPAGSDLVVLDLGVAPEELDDEGKSAFCDVRLQELDGDTITRVWGDSALDPIDFAYDEGASTGCISDENDPLAEYRVQFTFVVPTDAATDGRELALQLSVFSELPDYIRFRL
jgi:hypothetical protein